MFRGGELRERVAAHLLPGRVRRRHPQQRADGLLLAAARGQRRAPARHRDPAAARQRVACALHRRARRPSDPRRPARPAPDDRSGCLRRHRARAGGAALPRPRRLPAPHACRDRLPAESLVRVGALDGLGITEEGRPPTRDELLALLPEVKAVLAREGVAGDDTLCLAPAPTRPPEDPSHVSGWSAARRLSAELELTGLSLTAHPLALARRDLEARGVTWARDLRALPDRTRVRVVGVRERAQTPRTRSGKRTCFLTLEDPTGLLDVVVFCGRAGSGRGDDRQAPRLPGRRHAPEQLRARTGDRRRHREAVRGASRGRRARAAPPRRAERADGAVARRSGSARGGELGGCRGPARPDGVELLGDARLTLVLRVGIGGVEMRTRDLTRRHRPRTGSHCVEPA